MSENIENSTQRTAQGLTTRREARGGEVARRADHVNVDIAYGLGVAYKRGIQDAFSDDWLIGVPWVRRVVSFGKFQRLKNSMCPIRAFSDSIKGYVSFTVPDEISTRLRRGL
jgi:carbohydrate-selective porin OprB